MSDYHILDCAASQDAARVVFHITVPDEVNAAGVSYRTALVQYLGEIDSAVPGLDPTAHGLSDGSVYESVQTIEFSALLTNAQKRDAIEARYSALSALILQRAQKMLEFWGMSGDVA